MFHPFIINKPTHKFARHLLRHHPIEAEKILWEKLRHKQLGFWFKRQVSINKFIVDFYCPQKRLVIELDGYVHKNINQSNYDIQRDWYLRSMNFKILRFWNSEVVENINNVINEINLILHP